MYLTRRYIVLEHVHKKEKRDYLPAVETVTKKQFFQASAGSVDCSS